MGFVSFHWILQMVTPYILVKCHKISEISKNKKYFVSAKDLALADALIKDGFSLPSNFKYVDTIECESSYIAKSTMSRDDYTKNNDMPVRSTSERKRVIVWSIIRLSSPSRPLIRMDR